VACPHLTLFTAPAARGEARPLVGVTISKSVGGAVVRNRLRRRVQACLHELLAGSQPKRVLVIARPAAADLAYGALCGEISKALA
jgi:ribonuclease P protein component